VADAADMIVPLLREMRAENATLHQQTRASVDALDKRLGKIEETLTSYRQALTADSLLSKLVTGEFEERIEALERKVKDLETMK
jgi:polyhydroxyalkanoate synthesis regulator phasin